jgi:hypothetical protein
LAWLVCWHPPQKYALDHYVQKGLGGIARSPLGKLSPEVKKMIETDLAEDWAFEQSL